MVRLAPVADAATDSLCADIVAARRVGVTSCAVYERPEGRDEMGIANLIAAAHSFKALDRWGAIEQSVAIAAAAAVLARDLAYDTQTVAADVARVHAERFVTLFGEPATYLTNGQLAAAHAIGGRSGASWDPITPATFDTGVVIVGATRAGILWVQDED